MTPAQATAPGADVADVGAVDPLRVGVAGHPGVGEAEVLQVLRRCGSSATKIEISGMSASQERTPPEASSPAIRGPMM